MQQVCGTAEARGCGVDDFRGDRYRVPGRLRRPLRRFGEIFARAVKTKIGADVAIAAIDDDFVHFVSLGRAYAL
jgi:hypothetical protein